MEPSSEVGTEEVAARRRGDRLALASAAVLILLYLHDRWDELAGISERVIGPLFSLAVVYLVQKGVVRLAGAVAARFAAPPRLDGRTLVVHGVAAALLPALVLYGLAERSSRPARAVRAAPAAEEARKPVGEEVATRAPAAPPPDPCRLFATQKLLDEIGAKIAEPYTFLPVEPHTTVVACSYFPEAKSLRAVVTVAWPGPNHQEHEVGGTVDIDSERWSFRRAAINPALAGSLRARDELVADVALVAGAAALAKAFFDELAQP